MDSARQVIRWSIPGLLFFTNLLIFGMLIRIIGLHRTAEDVLDSYNQGGAVVAAVIASGIPLGFVLYQVYYSTYGPFTTGGFTRVDRGGWFFAGLSEHERSAVLHLLGLHGDGRTIQTHRVTFAKSSGRLSLHRLIETSRDLERAQQANGKEPAGTPFKLGAPSTCERSEYEQRFYFNLRCSQSLIHEICRTEPSNRVGAEYQTHSDLYHGLGAARTAVFAAGLVQVIIIATQLLLPGDRLDGRAYWEHHNEWWVLGTTIVMLSVLAAECMVLHKTRRHVWFNLCSCIQVAFKSFIQRQRALITVPAGRR
jgi:hypothetical protein